jgi:hypothetical protein
MEDKRNTNNPLGWACYFLAYLMAACGCKNLQEAVNAFQRSADNVMVHRFITDKGFYAKRQLSDNESIMLTCRWYYQAELIDGEVYIAIGRGVQIITLDDIDWWTERL